MDSIFSWKFFAFASAFFAALTAIFGKIGVSEINSNMATLIRTIVILMVSVLLVSVRKEWVALEAISAKSAIFLVLSGVATGFSWLCYYKALQIGEASKVAPVDKLSVGLVVILSVLFFKEAVSLKQWLGVIMIVLGTIVMVL